MLICNAKVHYVQCMFNQLMHYQQVMTLDIKNDPLLCEVFSAIPHSHALAWFHQLPQHSSHNF